jgi:hypothetical protein
MDPTGGLVKPAQVVGQLPSSYTGLVITFYFYFYLGGVLFGLFFMFSKQLLPNQLDFHTDEILVLY